MKGAFRRALLLATVWALPTAAQAGWVAQWTNTAVKGNERLSPESSSMVIDGGRVRLVQPHVISVIDYRSGEYTLMNPTRQYFWSGTIDEYVSEMTHRRAESLRAQFGRKPKGDSAASEDSAEKKPAVPKSDPTTWPAVEIRKTDETKKIAGHETVKYEVRTNGEPFQEIWIAPTLDLSADLDASRFLAQQQKLSAAMMGKPAGAYNALYANPEYRKLIEKSFALQVVTHFAGGGFERVVTEIRQATVPASDFEVPDSYRRVRLADVLAAEPGS